MDFENVITKRYSVRSFSSKPVEDEKIDAIINAGMIAPTGKNTQCQKIYVIKSKEGMEKLGDVCRVYNAPLVFLTCGDVNRQCLLSITGKSLMKTDVAIVHTHMMLECQNQGLGSCWICYFDPKKVKEIFNLPDNIVPLNLLAVGYPTDDCKPSDRHFESRPLEEIVEYL